MEWTDEAIILSVKAQGESAALVTLFTPQHGKWAGRLSGGQSTKKKAWLAVGNGVQAAWHSRLEEQLGTWMLEPVEQRAARVFDNPKKLLALSYLAALTERTLVERLPMPLLYHKFLHILDAIEDGDAPSLVIAYERALLDALGYGLDLTVCAVTGRADELTHISPNTGRAVSREAAAPYVDRLLKLPSYWVNGGTPLGDDILSAASVTGYFLSQHCFHGKHSLPESRQLIFN